MFNFVRIEGINSICESIAYGSVILNNPFKTNKRQAQATSEKMI